MGLFFQHYFTEEGGEKKRLGADAKMMELKQSPGKEFSTGLGFFSLITVSRICQSWVNKHGLIDKLKCLAEPATHINQLKTSSAGGRGKRNKSHPILRRLSLEHRPGMGSGE